MIVTFKEEKEDEKGEDKRLPQFVKCTMEQGQQTNNYGVKLSELAVQARSLVRDLDPSNDLTFLRV